MGAASAGVRRPHAASTNAGAFRGTRESASCSPLRRTRPSAPGRRKYLRPRHSAHRTQTFEADSDANVCLRCRPHHRTQTNPANSDGNVCLRSHRVHGRRHLRRQDGVRRPQRWGTSRLTRRPHGASTSAGVFRGTRRPSSAGSPRLPPAVPSPLPRSPAAPMRRLAREARPSYAFLRSRQKGRMSAARSAAPRFDAAAAR